MTTHDCDYIGCTAELPPAELRTVPDGRVMCRDHYEAMRLWDEPGAAGAYPHWDDAPPTLVAGAWTPVAAAVRHPLVRAGRPVAVLLIDRDGDRRHGVGFWRSLGGPDPAAAPGRWRIADWYPGRDRWDDASYDTRRAVTVIAVARLPDLLDPEEDPA